MPSIRRSLIGYFLLLLGLALAAVGLLVDRLARTALAARETAERRRLDQEYEARRKQTAAAFDDALVKDARALGKELELRLQVLFAEEQRKVRAKLAATVFGEQDTWAGLATLLVVSQNPGVRWGVFWADLAASQPDDVIRRSFEGDDHPPYFQFHLPGPGRGRVIRAPRQEFEFPLDPAVRRDGLDEPRFDQVTAPGVGPVRRVTTRSENRFMRLRGSGFGPPRPPSPPSTSRPAGRRPSWTACSTT